jgi:O-antigen/teichoic acid export membrane protein
MDFQENARKIAFNAFFQVAAKIASSFLGVLSIALLIRNFSSADYGFYATVIAYLTFASVLADMGLYTLMSRETANCSSQKEYEKISSSIFTLRFIFTILVFSLAPLLALLLPYPAEVKNLIFPAILAFIPLSLNQVLVGIFQKELAVFKISLSELIGRLVFIGLIFLFVKFQINLIAIIFSLAFANLLNFFLTFVFSRKYVKISFHFDLSILKKLSKESFPLAVIILLNLVYFKVDSLMLSLMKGTDDYAIYSVAYKILEVLVIFPGMFLGLVLPFLSRASNISEKFHDIAQKTFDFLMILAVPLLFGGLLLAKPIINLIANEKFPQAVPTFQILLFAVFMIFLGNLFSHLIIALKKQKKLVSVYFWGAFFSVLTNLIFIPFFSYFGAAATTVFVEALVALASFLLYRKLIKKKFSLKVLFKALLAALVMSAVIYFFPFQNLFLILFIATLVYFVVLFLLKGIPLSFIKLLLPKFLLKK